MLAPRNRLFYSTAKLFVPKLRDISISRRGRRISHDELFAYTNGHFLIDEERQHELRYLKFNLDALCNICENAGNRHSPIAEIEKLEGGFSKALLMKKQDGSEVIAKLPCRNAGPPVLTTASEVAVLEYVLQKTDIPVPLVYSWCSTASNPVGAEYIVMQKAGGVPLFQQWAEMTEYQKLQLIKGRTKLESQLYSLRFPAYGSLYLGPLDESRFEYTVLEEGSDSKGLFCVRPSCDRSFMGIANDDLPSMAIDKGPWTSLSAFGVAIAKKEIDRINGRNQTRSGTFYHGTREEKIALLEKTIPLMRLLDANTIISQHAQPTLWHTDLHMGNIFVSPEDPSKIVSLIDWQSIAILPAFLQAQWPVFVKPPSNYIKGLVSPKAPDDIDEFTEDEKTSAIQEWELAKMAKAYEVSSYLENRHAHSAMNAPRVFRELFTRCGEVSEFGIIPLRTCLIGIQENWSSLGFTGHCPYSYSRSELEKHTSQFEEYEAWHKVQQLVREWLDTDAEGWISPEMDISKKKRAKQGIV